MFALSSISDSIGMNDLWGVAGTSEMRDVCVSEILTCDVNYSMVIGVTVKNRADLAGTPITAFARLAGNW